MAMLTGKTEGVKKFFASLGLRLLEEHVKGWAVDGLWYYNMEVEGQQTW